MTDYIDRLVHSEPEGVREVGTINKLGVHKINAMAIPTRAVSAEYIEDREATYFALPEYPIPFWDLDDAGGPALEPLMTGDYALLKSAGISPEDFEIAVLEEQLERKPQ
jgi:hypothetical protein